MRDMWNFWKGEIARNGFVVVPLGCLIAVLAMNAVTGVKIGNWLVAAIFVLIGIGTAYAGTDGLSLEGWSGRKAALIGVFAFGIAFDQFCGWQTMGVSFADGQAARVTAADNLAALRKKLKDKQAERDVIGTPRPVETIKADLDLELRRTSSQYPKGDGPKATKLKGELGAAESVPRLEREIADLMTQLDGREQVAGGAAQFDVPLKIARAVAAPVIGEKRAKRIAERHVLFFGELFLVAFLGFWANFGFWLCGVRHVSFDGASGAGPRTRRASGAPFPRGEDADFWGPRAIERRAPSDGAGLPFSEGARGGNASVPIVVNVGIPGAGEAGRAAGSDVTGAGAVSAPEAPAKSVLPARRERHDLAALPSDAPPVDRSGVSGGLTAAEREAGDVLLAFRAACMVEAPGSVVAAEDLYRRYAAWAGQRAVDAPTFVALLELMTKLKVEMLAGRKYVRGVALRLGTSLQAVAQAS